MFAWTQKILELEPSTTPVGVEVSTGPLPGSASDQVQALLEELHALRRDQAKLQQAVFEAAQVQRRLCAPRELSWSEFEIAGEIFPVRHLSGDFFKVMQLGGDALGLAVGDIAGKGLTAGIWQAHLMGLVQHCARKHADPAEVLAEVNHELCQAGEPPMTALFFARIDRRTGEITYCNAGLPAPVVLRGDKIVNRLETGGPMVGAVQGADFQCGSITLASGDMLVAYSDGVTECRNARDDEFQMQRLDAAAKTVSNGSASKALFSLLGTVLDFAGSCAPGDDMTLLVVRRRPGRKNERAISRTKEFSVPPRRALRSRAPKNFDRGGDSPK